MINYRENIKVQKYRSSTSCK